MSDHSELKSEVAKEKPRDNEGHFVHAENPQHPQSPSSPQNPIGEFLSSHAHYNKSQDDLLDVHVGNPLRKIVLLLQDIKKQKAFSFTLKGSLGIMGVALVLSVFGIFGGGQVLCNRGVQSQIGVIKVLQVKEEPISVPVIGPLLSVIVPSRVENRIILVKPDLSTISLIGNAASIPNTKYQLHDTYVVTGQYDSCAQSLTVDNPASLQPYP